MSDFKATAVVELPETAPASDLEAAEADMATRKSKPHRRTSEGRYDTGTAAGMNSRFQEVTEAILAGACPPSINQLKKRYNMGYLVAKDYLENMEQQGYLGRNAKNGQYYLKTT